MTCAKESRHPRHSSGLPTFIMTVVTMVLCAHRLSFSHIVVASDALAADLLSYYETGPMIVCAHFHFITPVDVHMRIDMRTYRSYFLLHFLFGQKYVEARE